MEEIQQYYFSLADFFLSGLLSIWVLLSRFLISIFLFDDRFHPANRL
jgi:hypothetical protein